MEAWEREMFKELDFKYEAANLREVKANLAAAHIEAIVPRPIEQLVGTRAFVMSYEHGFKVADD